MNIEMINSAEKSHNHIETTKYGNQSAVNARMAEKLTGYSIDITGKVKENAAYGKKDLLSMEEISEKASLVDVSTQRNYMAVMSNSMSREDFSELLKEGYNPTHTEIKEQVTSLDRMKAKMAQSGQVIEGFNDDLSADELANALGSQILAGAVSATLQANDLPVSDDNIKDMTEAYDIASKLQPLNEDTIAYMLSNHMEPTISNIYIAEHSAAAETVSSNKTFVISNGAAYATGDLTQAAWSSIEKQATDIIEQAGLTADEETIADAKWLVENQIPLAKENLEDLSSIRKIEIPFDNNRLFTSMAAAMAEGRSAKDANLSVTDSIFKRAADIAEKFGEDYKGSDITKLRQIEEIRLSMTVEANLTLLRKGISIDTQNLEKLVEDLKKAEEEFYAPLLEGNGQGTDIEMALSEKINLFKQTEATVAFLRSAPAQSVGDLISAKAELTLNNLQSTASAAQADYEKAGRSYETLMTAPRADMGDSITKAFRNVDDILSDMNMALSDDNRKAVRIMGYSQIQITRENLENIREAAKVVESVIERMTPAKTLEMIREGHNPLTENLYALDKELRKETIEQQTEKYSEFLMKLERRGEITEDEKSAYIGMYRLFDKIEKRDSRVIGKVLSAGEDLTFKNLLSAYRSGKFAGLDFSIDDEFGALENVISRGESITDQIERGFSGIRDEAVPQEYVDDKLEMINSASKMDSGKTLLEQIEMPVNVENILAANDFTSDRKAPFGKITGRAEEKASAMKAKEIIRESASKLIDSLIDKETAAKAYDEFAKEAVSVTENMMESEDSYINLKEWSRLHKQIQIASNMTKGNEYEIPIETDDGYFSIHLKLRQSSEHEGKVEISFDTERFGMIKTSLSVNDNKISGIITSEYNGGLEFIRNKEQQITASFETNGFSVSNMAYVRVTASSEAVTFSEGEASNTQLFKAAKAFLKAIEKE